MRYMFSPWRHNYTLLINLIFKKDTKIALIIMDTI